MDIANAVIASYSRISGSGIVYGATHDPSLDKTFYCSLVTLQGIIGSRSKITFDLSGWAPVTVAAVVITPPATVPWVKAALPAPITTLTSRSGVLGDYFTSYNSRNWVAWSKIGSVDFTIDREDDAGWGPMPWQGWIYQLKMLGNNVVAYGANGITLLTPNEMSMFKHTPPTYGKTKLHHTGLLARNAVCGDLNAHYFIDAIGQLCVLTTQGVKLLGYAEYLFPMRFAGTPLIMFYEWNKQWVYICNGKVGYILTPLGLGGGPKNLTGLAYVGTDPVWISNGALEFDLPWFTTELFDLGNRDVKACYGLYISTSTPQILQGMVEYRTDMHRPYLQTPWRDFNAAGKAFFNVSGVEFRVSVRSQAPTQLIIDDFKIYTRVNDRTLKQIAYPNTGGSQ